MFSPRDAVLVAAGVLSGALAAFGATAAYLSRKHRSEVLSLEDNVSRQYIARKEAMETANSMKRVISEQGRELDFFRSMPADLLKPYLPTEESDVHAYDPDVEEYESEGIEEGLDDFGCKVYSDEEWGEREKKDEFDPITLRYYVKDDALVGPNDIPVDFPQDIIGDALSVIRIPSSGTTVAHIRNYVSWGDIELHIYADAYFEKEPQ